MAEKLSPQDWEAIGTWLPRIVSAQFLWSLQALKSEARSAQAFTQRSPDGRLQAFLLWRDLPDALEIQALASDPDLHRQGHMSQLLRAFIAEHQKGRPIWLEVHAENLGARNLYEKFHFLEQGRRPRYYRDGGDALICTLEPITPCEG